MRIKRSRIPLIAISLIALTASSLLGSSCASQPRSGGDVPAAVQKPRLPRPPEPSLRPVHFEDKDGGLWLSYADYRALEGNVKALRAYAEELELLVEYYEEAR